MSNWKNYATNALESFNPLNDIEDKSSREEAKRRERFRVFKITHALRKQVVIKPKFIDVKAAN